MLITNFLQDSDLIQTRVSDQFTAGRMNEN